MQHNSWAHEDHAPPKGGPPTIRVLHGKYEQRETLQLLRQGDVAALAPQVVLNASATRVVQLALAITVVRELVYLLLGNRRTILVKEFAHRISTLTQDQKSELLARIPVLDDHFVARGAAYLRGLGRFQVDPFHQATSGALFTCPPSFWCMPPFSLHRQNVSYTDDENAVYTRRAKAIPCEVATIPNAVVLQDRHPGGGPTGSDLRWHLTTYLRAHTMGLAQRAMLDQPLYQTLLRHPGTNLPGIEEELWQVGRDVLLRYAEFARSRSFENSVLGVVVNGGRHRLFPIFAALGFCTFAPEGLTAAVNYLPERFPNEPLAHSPVGSALQMLVEDMLAYASESYQRFWREMVKLAPHLNV